MSYYRTLLNSCTHYCADLTCEGRGGFQVKWHPATMTDPAWPDTDACPICGMGMIDDPVNLAEPVDAFLTALDEAHVAMPTSCDEDELLRVVAVELKRQWAAERSAARQRLIAQHERQFGPLPF